MSKKSESGPASGAEFTDLSKKSFNPDGRPALPEEEKRSERITAYVTPGERDKIMLQCHLAGVSISDFLRDLALDKEIRSTANPKALREIRADIGKIGSNLNQIARVCNQSGQLQKAEQLEEFISELKSKLDEL